MSKIISLCSQDGGTITSRPFTPRNLRVMRAYANELVSMGLFAGGIFVRIT